MGKQRVIALSIDALVFEDVEYLLTKPNFRYLYDNGSIVEKVRTIYPSVTYPCHVSMSTGCYPDKHGVTNNLEFIPGKLKNIPWNWFADVIKCPDVFTAAKKAGLTTAAVFWPVTGNHKDIDYLIDEYWPQGDWDTQHDCFIRSGSTEEVWKTCIEPTLEGCTIRKHPETDYFNIKSACAIIKNYKPDLLLIHPGHVDSYRHSTGVFSPKVTKGLDETDEFIGMLIEATKEAGVFEETNFFIVSDHGQMNIVRSVKPNAVFADNGLISVDENGKLVDWKAYCHSAGMSAQVRLKDPTDKETYDKVYELLKWMRDEGIYGIGEVRTVEDTKENDHLDGPFSFVLETDGYTSFAEDWKHPIAKSLDTSDYRFGHATHGYHPSKGPQPTLIACGPAIQRGVTVEMKRTIDEAPTYAKILGAEMPWADGSPIDEILK